MNNSPLVTVIIPVYNTQNYIATTVQSVLKQTERDLELIVMNDGSTDESENVVKQLMQQDSRVKYHYKPNSGVSDTRNKAIALARGRFIAFLDADDVWLPDNLEKKLKAITQSGKPWAYSDLELIDHEGKIMNGIPSKLGAPNLLERLLLWEADTVPGPCSNIVVTRELLGDDVRFDIKLSSPADRDICIQLARKAEPVLVNEKLWQYRQHPQSMTSMNKKVSDEVVSFINKLKSSEWFNKLKIRKRSLSNLYLMLAGICYKFTGQKGRAIRFFILSFLYSPGNIWQKKVLPLFSGKK